jgi:hypothetical protein
MPIDSYIPLRDNAAPARVWPSLTNRVMCASVNPAYVKNLIPAGHMLGEAPYRQDDSPTNRHYQKEL